MLRPVHIYGHIDSEGGEKETDTLNFKLTPVKCKYHELCWSIKQDRCLACGEPYDRKKDKFFKHVDKVKKK